LKVSPESRLTDSRPVGTPTDRSILAVT
jgi:hypothetical protein